MLNNRFIIGTTTLVAITFISGAILSSSSIIATSTSTTASVNVAEACTMNASIDTPHTATVSPNTYQADIGITTLNVICNDANGFALYAVGYTGDEIGGTNSTKLVSSSSTIDTGIATSGNTSNWAMKISTSGLSYVGTIDNSFGSYHIVPSEYTKVAHRDSGTDAGSNATGSTYQTTYAAFITGTQGAGNYVGKVKYTMVHPNNEVPPHEVACPAGKICYNANTNIVEGQMGQQTIPTYATSIELYAPNFKKIGYGFAGWSDKYNYETNPDAHFYGPNETITFTAGQYTGSNSGLSLYAVWIKSQGSLQNWDGCSNLPQGSTTALTDERDSNTYAIAKLIDNKCWTIENLRLADKDANGNYIYLSSSSTHNPSLPLTNDYTNSTTSNHLSPSTDPNQIAWCNANTNACDNQSMLNTNNTTLFINNTPSDYSAYRNVYSYGNYYNWYSATAGHGKYETSINTNVQGDICPAGWHLPRGGNKTNEATNEYWTLIVIGINNGVKPANYDNSIQPSYASTTESSPIVKALEAYPNNFVESGYVHDSSIANRSNGGAYWSSTTNGGSASNSDMDWDGGSLDPGTGGLLRNYGLVVRCIAGV